MLSVDNEKLFPLVLLPDSDVIAAGPLTKQPGTILYRVVLRYDGKDFIVHDEELKQKADGSFKHVGFGRGAYCGNDLPRAAVLFGERVAQQQENLKSLYRQD